MVGEGRTIIRTVKSGYGLGMTLALAAMATGPASATVTIEQPTDGQQFTVEQCPVGPCRAEIQGRVRIQAPESVYRIHFETTNASDPSQNDAFNLCEPPDIEPGDTCPPELDFTLPNDDIYFGRSHREGDWTWTVTAYSSVVESASVSFRVEANTDPTPGPVKIYNVLPDEGVPTMWLRDPGPPSNGFDDLGDGMFGPPFADPSGTLRVPGEEIEFRGENLHNNDFLEVYLVPVTLAHEPQLDPGSGLPTHEWCEFPAEIIDRGVLPDGTSYLRVTIPEVERETPVRCDIPVNPGNSFKLRWRWLIEDPWTERPEWVRLHEAVPDPRVRPEDRQPYFQLVTNEYPRSYGFNFPNKKEDASFAEFTAVFGDNAIRCIRDTCWTKALYAVYYPVYKGFINSSGGSCNGMAATSSLMAWQQLAPEDFHERVHFPFGFTRFPVKPPDPDPGFYVHFPTEEDWYLPSEWRGRTPAEPFDLFAEIRKNHGVQATHEFLAELFDQMWDRGGINPGTLAGIPTSSLQDLRLAQDSHPHGPSNYVLCITEIGGGHCVTPYRVEGDNIFVYDNNHPSDTGLYIEIDRDTDTYHYPKRADDLRCQGGEKDGEACTHSTASTDCPPFPNPRITCVNQRCQGGSNSGHTCTVDEDCLTPIQCDGKTPYEGKGLFLIHRDIWENGRTMPGLRDVGQLLFFLVLGDGDTLVTNEDGARWGYEPDGTFVDTGWAGASLTPLGPPEEHVRQIPLILPEGSPEPRFQVNADGGPYLFHAVSSGQLLQLESSDASEGDADIIDVGYEEERIASFSFAPQHDASRLVSRGGLQFSEDSSAVFHWLGLEVPGGRTLAFGVDKAARAGSYRNDSGAPTWHVLLLDAQDVAGQVAGRWLYGPFEVPDGAIQRAVLADWPDVADVISELDLDGDGVPETSRRVAGRPVGTPVELGLESDLSVVKAVSPEVFTPGEPVDFEILVSNDGPEPGTGVTVTDALPPHAEVSSIQSTRGTCQVIGAEVTCDLGDFGVGEMAAIRYVVETLVPGTLANGAFVSGHEGDPDWTNNTAVATALAPIQVDIKPGSNPNSFDPGSNGVVPVAVLGEPGFDVNDIDVATLAFGPAGAAPDHKRGGHVEDVNDDGFPDLISHYGTREIGLVDGDELACVTAMTLDGRSLEGCDDVQTVPAGKPKDESEDPPPTEESVCGLGVELVLLAPLLGRLQRRRGSG